MAAAAKTDNLVSALIKAHDEMPDLIKDAKNPHFRSTFSSLPNVIETVTPSLHKHGLVVTQVGDVDEQGRASLKTILRHKSGEEIVSSLPLRAANEDNPQQLGSSITYMRRYGLLAVLNLAADDDDGESATGRGNNPANGGGGTSKGVSDAQMKLIKSLLGSVRSAKSKTAGNEVSEELVGKPLDTLTSKDATTLIDKLKEEQNARKGAF